MLPSREAPAGSWQAHALALRGGLDPPGDHDIGDALADMPILNRTGFRGDVWAALGFVEPGFWASGHCRCLVPSLELDWGKHAQL